jgi:hypothetical protein
VDDPSRPFRRSAAIETELEGATLTFEWHFAAMMEAAEKRRG